MNMGTPEQVTMVLTIEFCTLVNPPEDVQVPLQAGVSVSNLYVHSLEN